MRNYLLGLLTIPALLFAAWVVGLLYRAGRDTWRTVRTWEVRPGYSRWWIPPLAVMCFADELREQLKAWANGYDREVMP